MARLKLSAGTRHSRGRSRPAINPRAAMSRQGCGPESPRAIGSGGSRMAAQRNVNSQRFAEPVKIHQPMPRSSAGVSKAIAAAGVRTNAIRAEYTPRKIETHSQRGRTAESIMPAGYPDGAAVQFDSLRRVAQLERDTENRQSQRREQRDSHIQRNIRERRPFRHDAGIDNTQPLAAKAQRGTDLLQTRFGGFRARLRRRALGGEPVHAGRPRSQ